MVAIPFPYNYNPYYTKKTNYCLITFKINPIEMGEGIYGFLQLYTGKEFEAYQYLGAHVLESGTTFRTFAPAAQRVSVIGEFNGWTETPMNRVHDGNFWECTIDGVGSDLMYKYRIYRQDGSFIDHADPYAFYSEMRPGTASKTYALGGYKFKDAKWQKGCKVGHDKPINIYEMHFGSWKKRGEGQEDWYTYEELAPILIAYLKEYGYNYVEIMPLCEYPCDESWGYQDTGYFSPTARYGKPEELKSFVDQCHQAGIGVILDFVPVHFAVNDYALAEYDGTALYEYPNMAVGRNEWGSCNFMHSRGEVCSFLQSSAYYWLREFHFDGLRMDAVGNLIYWQGDANRGENLAALKFIRTMNQGLKERVPECLLLQKILPLTRVLLRLSGRADLALTTNGILAGCTTPCPISRQMQMKEERSTTS